MYDHHARTVDESLLSDVHGRQRRQERKIPKIDLKRARKYGMEETARNGRLKYTYGGIVFIYDPHNNREVTTYKSRDFASTSSGTKVTEPCILRKTDYNASLHSESRVKYRAKKASWTSHSVLVVDMSGSMRRDDVNGARCRSDAVWTCIAREYIKKQLKKKSVGPTDFISIVLMRDEEEKTYLKCEPITWHIYNKLVDMREWEVQRPSGPGNYMPALKKAQRLLRLNTRGTCALSLLFFSDGKPSDKGDFVAEMGKIASQFGRRLSVSCIGMAEREEDFSVLKAMAKEATSYGANANFAQPSLDADSLSNIVTSLASSLTSSKTEMTDLASGKSKKVRDVLREKKDAPDDTELTTEWWEYSSRFFDSYVDSIDTWGHYKLNDFVRYVDPRCANCFESCRQPSPIECIICGAVRWCSALCKDEHKDYHATQCRALKRKLDKSQIKVPPADKIPSWNVAIKSTVFGEGAERVVHKFRFLDGRGKFIGPLMVAKESRYVVEEDDTAEKRRDYHRDFMRTQSIASEFARKFNEALDGLLEHFTGEQNRRAIMKFPRIEFLEPLLVNVHDTDLGYISTLIEPMLDVLKYKKFNNNMGYVEGAPKVSMDDLLKGMGALTLDSIHEHDDESEDSDDDEEEFFAEANAAPDNTCASYSPRQEDFPQAFSHFTHFKSKGALMVTDLQGVFTTTADGGYVYKLTDPAVHKRKRRKGAFKKWDFGRTDRGSKGMRLFFASHKCSSACKLLGLPEGEDNFIKKTRKYY